MTVGIDAHGLQRLQVDLLGVTRIGLEDDLVLVMLLHAVGVLAVAAVIRTDGWLDVGHVPGLGAKDAQEGSRIIRTGADLSVVRLPDETAFFSPEGLQGEDHRLKGI